MIFCDFAANKATGWFSAQQVIQSSFLKLTLYFASRRFFGVKLETDIPENLKKALLKNGLSSDVADRIVKHYIKELDPEIV